MAGITRSMAASTSTASRAPLTASLLMRTSMSASNKGRAPKAASTTEPLASIMGPYRVPQTGELWLKRFCTAGLVSPAL